MRQAGINSNGAAAPFCLPPVSLPAETCFSVMFSLSFDDVLAWKTLCARNAFADDSWRDWACNAFNALGAIAFLVCCGLALFHSPESVRLLMFACFFLGWGCLMLVQFFRRQQAMKTIVKSAGLRGPHVLHATVDELCIQNQNGYSRIKNAAIVRVEQDEQRLFLLLDESSAIIILKSALDDAGLQRLLELDGGR